MRKITMYSLAIVFCLTGFYPSLDFREGLLRQNELSIPVDDRRRMGADNADVVTSPDVVLDSGAGRSFARFLWRDASPAPLVSPDRLELQWSEQGTLSPDQLLARFLWQDEPSQQGVGDAEVVLEPDVIVEPGAEHRVARFLWRDASPAPLVSPDRLELQWSEQGTLSPDQLLARFLWQDEPSQQGVGDAEVVLEPDVVVEPGAEQRVARFLWRDASPAPLVSPDRLELQWSEQGTLSPDQLLARFLWQDETANKDADRAKGINVFVGYERNDYIVSGKDLSAMKRVMDQLGIEVTHELPLISSLAVSLTDKQTKRLKKSDQIANLFASTPLKTANVRPGREDKGAKTSIVQPVVQRQSDNNSSRRSVITGAQSMAVATVRKGRSGPAVESGSNDFSLLSGLVKSSAAGTASMQAPGQRGSNQIPATRNSASRESFEGTDYPALVRADLLHKKGIKGASVGVAIIDTGLWASNFLAKDSKNSRRINAYYDAIGDFELDPSQTDLFEDPHGHGTHIASLIGNSAPTRNKDGSPSGGTYSGIAPDSELTVIRAFDSEGKGSYADVVRGITFAIENKDRLNIDVINMSFGGQPRSHYWDDPINKAVMAAWDAGIVVIASAGNLGPDPMSITVPGNVPYVVTVGAMTDSYTPDDRSDDKLTSFSGVGPTLEGFVKPEMIAPGGHMRGLMQKDTTLAEAHPEFHDGGDFFVMSGTSQSAAVVTGIAALIIDANPGISPDDVKCKLMSSALSATVDGENVYSVFQQGAGLVDAVYAVESEALGCANASLDIAKDISGEEHYGGPAKMNESGEFAFWSNEDYAAIPSEHLLDADGFIWQYSDFENQGFLWQYGFIWQYSDIENQGFLWQYFSPENQGFLWQYSDFETNGLNWDIDSLVQNGLVGNLGEGMQDSGFLWQYGSPEIARWVNQE